MAGRVDEVELVALPVDAHGLCLDRDPALALELHGVEHLLAHLPTRDGVGELEDAVGERRLAVVDVGDDRKVANSFLVHAKLTRGADGLATIATRPAHEPAANGRKRGTRARPRRVPRRPRRPGRRTTGRGPRRGPARPDRRPRRARPTRPRPA